MSTTGRNPRHGFEYVVDFATMSRSLCVADMVERPWEDHTSLPLRGVGMFRAGGFDPGASPR